MVERFLLILSVLWFAGCQEGNRQTDEIPVLEISDGIDAGVVANMEDRLHELQRREPESIVIVIDVYGGEMRACLNLADAIAKCPVPVVGYVRMAGAGGLFSVAACDRIFVADNAVFVGGAPVAGTDPELTKMADKLTKQMTSEIETIAGLKGHPAQLFRALIAPEEVVEMNGHTISPAGESFTLTAEEALLYAIAEGKASSVEELITLLSRKATE